MCNMSHPKGPEEATCKRPEFMPDLRKVVVVFENIATTIAQLPAGGAPLSISASERPKFIF